jgi:hypothetical protein
MTRALNIIAQLATGAGQMLVPVMPVDEGWKTFAHAALAFISFGVSIIAHEYTPTGDKIR